jgi:hypothetical protein
MNLLKVKMLSMIEKRMAFYANLLDGDKLKLNDEEAREWRRDLPKAVEAQYAAIDRGCLPIAMTLENVRRLKTLDVSNENPRALQRDGLCGEGRERDGARGDES